MDDSELRAMFAAQQAQIAELLAATRPAPVVMVPLAELYASYEAASRSRASWPTIMYLLRPVLAAFGERPAAALKASDWTTYRTEREGKYSGSTLNQQLAWLKTLLRWSVEQGALTALPHLCKTKPRKCKNARETATTEDDVEALLAIACPEERVMVLCACDAGMRRNEIRQLQRSWIDRERMEIRLPNWACKGQRGRTVLVTRRLLDAIDAIPRDISSSYVLTSPAKDDKGRPTHQPYHGMTLGKWWRELARTAGLKAVPGEARVTPHCGRAGFATEAIERGVPIEDVSEMLGHASLETTRIYIRRHGKRRHDALARARERFETGIKSDRR